MKWIKIKIKIKINQIFVLQGGVLDWYLVGFVRNKAEESLPKDDDEQWRSSDGN
jgi:hypothetical protein